MKSLFITGIGTGIGKTLVSAIIAEALQADYWKPVQAGVENSDAEWIQSVLPSAKIHPEAYKLRLAASPHIAAKDENIKIDIEKILSSFNKIKATSPNEYIVIEGAGGLLVPLNDKEFVIDLIKKLDASVILVSRNYLGSINHSLLTAEMCKNRELNVIGWVFNDQYLDYENEIVKWTGYPKIASIPHTKSAGTEFIIHQAEKFRQSWKQLSLQKHR